MRRPTPIDASILAENRAVYGARRRNGGTRRDTPAAAVQPTITPWNTSEAGCRFLRRVYAGLFEPAHPRHPGCSGTAGIAEPMARYWSARKWWGGRASATNIEVAKIPHSESGVTVNYQRHHG